MFLNRHAHCGVLVLAALFPVPAFAAAQEAPTVAAEIQALHLPTSAGVLARETIQNELKASNSKQRFEYRGRRQTTKGSQTKQYIETDDGIIARLIAVNDQPISPSDQKKEDERLHKLLTDPAMQAKRHKQQQEDADRVRKMLKSMPDAFIYKYERVEQSNDGPIAKLSFSPDPNFSPPNRETEIYRGMNGYMLVNANEKRLVQIAGTLFQEVNFGWGILGRLNPGGHFIVKQTEIGPGRWETTEQDLKFTGKVFLFKSLNIDERETESDFQTAPSLTLEQGVAFLEHQNPVVAKSGAQSAT